ncbi:Riboflavin biosynthesis protein RibD [compost metagenome]
MYVNLEPCAHFGKTPPCADLLIKHNVKRVVISNTDPFPYVAGKGISRLKGAGIQVETGILAQEGAFLNRRFFTRIQKQRPYVILKWAQTANGYFAPLQATQHWISGAAAKMLTHRWRGEEDAILVGKNTALIDNPQLTNRLSDGKDPVRIVIDRDLSIPLSHHILNAEAKTIILNEKKTVVMNNLHYIQMEDMHYYLPQKIAFQLYLMDIQSVIIEGGKQLLSQFIEAGLWDEARIFTSATSWESGISAPEIHGKTGAEEQLEDDKLSILFNTEI